MGLFRTLNIVINLFLLCLITAFFAGFGCGGGGGGEGDRSLDPTLTSCAATDPDCDDDGLAKTCDEDDNDEDNVGIKATCDADGDGHVDSACTDASPALTDGSISCDNCIGTFNPDQANGNGGDFGDACDACGAVADRDGDGVCDNADNCVCPEGIFDCALYFNPDQTADLDGDGEGDICDSDKDGDGTANSADNCPDAANADQADGDGDGLGDGCDTDRDGDGVTDATALDGSTIEGGTDECLSGPDAAPTADNLDDFVVEGTLTTVDPETGYYVEWNGCCFDTDGDTICDHEEAVGCVNIVNTEENAGEVCADTDGDGTFDDDDPDIDNDSLNNDEDLCPSNFDTFYIALSSDPADDWFDDLIEEEKNFMTEGAVIGGMAFGCVILAIFGFDYEECIETVLSLADNIEKYNYRAGTSGIEMEMALNYSTEDVIKDHLEEYQGSYCFDCNPIERRGTLQCDNDNDGTGCACDPNDSNPWIPFLYFYIPFDFSL